MKKDWWKYLVPLLVGILGTFLVVRNTTKPITEGESPTHEIQGTVIPDFFPDQLPDSLLDPDSVITETLWVNAPDTCQKWLDKARALIDSLQDSLKYWKARVKGKVIFGDSTYDWFTTYATAHYPDGKSSIRYQWKKTIYTSR